eukprot:6217205-Alexandrium_andersonii.AAC.1
MGATRHPETSCFLKSATAPRLLSCNLAASSCILRPSGALPPFGALGALGAHGEPGAPEA